MKGMLPNKKYYFFVEPTKSCLLSFSVRWIYSFLVFRTSLNKPASESCIVRNCGISNRAVKHYLNNLRDVDLLAEDNRYYLANEPGQCWEWFVLKRNSEPLPWFKRFATYAVYIPNPRQKLPLSHSALLSLVYSLTQGGWNTIRTTGLATMLYPNLKRSSAKRQVNRAAKNLREKGLLGNDWEITIQKEHHRYWRDADHLINPRSRSDVGYVSLRKYVVDILKDYQCQYFFDDLWEMGNHLDRCEEAMRLAGYNQQQILQYWNDVIYAPSYCDRKGRWLEVFIAKAFLSVFKTAEDLTKENRITKGYVGISLGLLRKLTEYEMLTFRDLANKRNAEGGSLLRNYEPNTDRRWCGSR
jgi:hypothetical protein